MLDQEIIELFHQRSELAITELDKKYGKLLHKLSYNILNDSLDAEECVNDCYLGAWNTIPPENPNPLLTYICKIVRNISIKRYDRKTALKRNSIYDVALEEIEDCLAVKYQNDFCAIERELEMKELTSIIEQFLDTLSSQNRVIFLRRYWFSDTYAIIAKEVGISEKNVSVRLVRMREKLKKYLKERGIFV